MVKVGGTLELRYWPRSQHVAIWLKNYRVRNNAMLANIVTAFGSPLDYLPPAPSRTGTGETAP